MKKQATSLFLIFIGCKISIILNAIFIKKNEESILILGTKSLQSC